MSKIREDEIRITHCSCIDDILSFEVDVYKLKVDRDKWKTKAEALENALLKETLEPCKFCIHNDETCVYDVYDPYNDEWDWCQEEHYEFNTDKFKNGE